MRGGRRKKVAWSAADMKLLRKLAGRERAAGIARKLKRTVLAVRFKAHTKRISLALRHSG